jgi:2Fe-2S ferredoxin
VRGRVLHRHDSDSPVTETYPVTAIDPSGSKHELAARPARSLMALLRQNRLPILATCGGCLSCATCHILVDPEWSDRLPPPSPEEQELLSQQPGYRPGRSRLACQIQFTPALAGLVVAIVAAT